MDWSSGAEQALVDYCQRIRRDLAGTDYDGADADEVADDIRRHVDEDMLAEGVEIVTREQVERALDRLGRPVASTAEDPAPRPSDTTRSEQAPPPSRTPGLWGTATLCFFGVIGPLITLLVELTTGMCANGPFDPIPTMGHVLAIALVPLANAVVLRRLFVPKPHMQRRLGILNAAALAISGYYTVLFVPIMPLAVIGVAFMGVGLLPLSPFFALISTLYIRSWIWRATAEAPAASVEPAESGEPAGSEEDLARPPVPGLLAGLLLGFGALAAASAPHAVTGIGLHLAASDTPTTSERGVRMLRTIGSDYELLRRCYGRPQSATDPLALILDVSDPVATEEARKIYYRVTGRAFNTSPPPVNVLRDALLIDPTPFFGDDDDERGGDKVGGRSRGLSLASSRIDAQLDADAAFAYTEWTLSFENRSSRESLEARALISLPPGGVVSRLTLWVDGEEREAAFAGRSDVRRAYEDIVRKQRDPVLATSAGPGLVLLQCFPVLPNGGTMKVRIGITAPLALTGSMGAATCGQLRLPGFVERNFAIGSVEHSVWIEAHRRLNAGELPLVAQQPADGRFALRGSLDDGRLSGSGAVVGVARDGESNRTWTPVAGRDDIEQVVRTEPVDPAQRIIIVVDGSIGMAAHSEDLSEALASLPEGCEFTLLMAADVAETAVPLAISSPRTPKSARSAVEHFDFIGGRDAVPALVAALDLAVGHDGARILWVHGPQPVRLDATDALMQFADRCGGQGILYDMQIAPGPNVIARELVAHGALVAAPRSGAWDTDLARLLTDWGTGGERFVLDRRPLSPTRADREGPPASLHLARLWAFDEVQRLAAKPGKTARAAAVALAIQHQLVTSVTGAVVLENDNQYTRAGLKAVDAATVPILPEPEFVLIVLLAALVAFASFLARRRRAQRVSA